MFLISTRAGGLGLNLVSANRVVIFDPNWNPAQDLQAQDRSFRFGQKRHVTVFRLLSAGSIEELVYSRQVYKQQLSNIAVAGKMEKRYFEGVQVSSNSTFLSIFCHHIFFISNSSQINSFLKDCKEYQGELFGICNLFRDLSDELFTSDIVGVGVHDKQGKEHKQDRHGAELDLTELGVYLDPPREETPSVESETKNSHDRRKTRANPTLEDLGEFASCFRSLPQTRPYVQGA